MEARNRSFKPVNVGMINAEFSEQRFPRTLEERAPAIQYWRLNLTALSQRYNLYFVATCDKIQVYKPEFPYQTLGAKSLLTIIPQLSNPSAEGYIHPPIPHAINHLIVGDLGNQEILLFSTDSGNVVAYHTSSINTAVKKDARKFSSDANADLVGLRPFFAQWVHESAWGLAIHSEGRMIAVSANTPRLIECHDPSSKITVFAFALTAPGEDQTSEEEEAKHALLEADPNFPTEEPEWRLWSPLVNVHQSDTPTRDRNYKIILGGLDGHKDNTPCINFVNGPEDTTGSWLFSTDVVGRMKIWQIWTGKCFRTWDLSNQSRTTVTGTRPSSAGWIVAALDMNCFRPSETMDKFIGYHTTRQYFGYHASGDSYDLTNTVLNFTPQNSSFHPWVPVSEGDTSEEELDELNEDMDESDAESQHDSWSQRPTTSPRVVETRSHSDAIESQALQRASDVPSNDDDPDDDELLAASDDDGDPHAPFDNDGMDIEMATHLSDDENDDISASVNASTHSPASSSSVTSASSYDHRNSIERDMLTGTELPSEAASLAPGIQSPRRTGPKAKSIPFSRIPKLKDQVQMPKVPIIHCSTSHLRFFAGPTAQFPHIFCARMLRQTLPDGLDNTNFAALDRLCLFQQIPELGIALIATQLGRCAVCTLTKRTRDGLLGLRVDWILPTKKQERRGIRPVHAVLLGIAASPVQGHSVPKPNPLSEYDNDQDWMKDRIINGTPTTFDPVMVALNKGSQTQELNRRSGKAPVENSTTTTQNPKWRHPGHNEPWRPFETSRRYRLMLTYTNMTVLTYEISRGVEKEDIRVDVTDGQTNTSSLDLLD